MKNILIVEDDSLIAGDIESTLKRLGHSVSGVAASGQEALQNAIAYPPALALLDIQLKGKMDGVETAHRLRDAFHTPIIYLTAHADANTLKRTKYTEPYGYIIKPFRENDLRAAIEMAAYKSQMDGALRENEARFRTLSESTPMIAWVAKADGDCAYLNPAWMEFTGKSFEESRGKGWTKSFHPEDLERSLRIYKAAYESRQPFRTEYRLRRHDGAYRWMEGYAVPLYTPESVFEGYIGACADIHDHKAARQAMEKIIAERTGPNPGPLVPAEGGAEVEKLALSILGMAEGLRDRLGAEEETAGRIDGIASAAKALLAAKGRPKIPVTPGR